MARPDAPTFTGRTPKEPPKPPALDDGGIDRHVYDLPVDAKRIKGSTTITGQVDSAGNITAGSGFTINKTGTGVYEIHFTAVYAAAPTVIAVVAGASSGEAVVFSTAADQAVINTYNSTATASNRAFNFVAFITI